MTTRTLDPTKINENAELLSYVLKTQGKKVTIKGTFIIKEPLDEFVNGNLQLDEMLAEMRNVAAIYITEVLVDE